MRFGMCLQWCDVALDIAMVRGMSHLKVMRQVGYLPEYLCSVDRAASRYYNLCK